MTALEFEVICLKFGGAVLGLIAFWWIRTMVLGLKSDR